MTTGPSPKTVLISGASSGFGALTARELASAGHIVFAGMRNVSTRNRAASDDVAAWAADHHADLRTVEMDVVDQESVDAAVASVIEQTGRLDVVVHNAGHMVLGPAEAFTPEQLAAVYDVNVLSAQRLNRAALPHLRARRDGLVVWIGSTSTRGGTPPYLAPYFAAKAAMDALAVSYAAELARFGVDTTIVVPGSFTVGTNHFAHAGHAQDGDVAAAYEAEYAGLMDQVGRRLAALAPADQDPTEVARAVARAVDTPKGRRPFRVHIDPADDGAEVVNAVGDRIRDEFYRRIGLEDLLRPAVDEVGRPAH
ncbi:SDR family oxidoreductase [Jatrophihabitans fulvus]